MIRGEKGFTLLEVLVAFVIAALALGGLFRGTLSGLRIAQVAGQYEEAVTRAQSHLAALTAGGLTTGDRQGEDGNGFHWRVRVTPVDLADAGSSALYAVYVSISWVDGTRRSVELDSERIGVAPRQGP
jgi:general secretion pathway protein I